MKLDAKVQRVGPVVPFRAMRRGKRLNRDPRHAQRIGNDRAVHRLAEQHPAASDRSDDRGRIAARIDQFDAGRRGRFHPGATLRAFEMRHEGDRVATTDAAPTGLGQQHGRIAEAICGVKPQLTCGAGAANPVDHPARIQHGQGRVAAIAGAGDQLHRVPRHAVHRAPIRCRETILPGRRPSCPAADAARAAGSIHPRSSALRRANDRGACGYEPGDAWRHSPSGQKSDTRRRKF